MRIIGFNRWHRALGLKSQIHMRLGFQLTHTPHSYLLDHFAIGCLEALKLFFLLGQDGLESGERRVDRRKYVSRLALAGRAALFGVQLEQTCYDAASSLWVSIDKFEPKRVTPC